MDVDGNGSHIAVSLLSYRSTIAILSHVFSSSSTFGVVRTEVCFKTFVVHNGKHEMMLSPSPAGRRELPGRSSLPGTRRSRGSCSHFTRKQSNHLPSRFCILRWLRTIPPCQSDMMYYRLYNQKMVVQMKHARHRLKPTGNRGLPWTMLA